MIGLKWVMGLNFEENLDKDGGHWIVNLKRQISRELDPTIWSKESGILDIGTWDFWILELIVGIQIKLLLHNENQDTFLIPKLS
jgi:hypothetical protein